MGRLAYEDSPQPRAWFEATYQTKPDLARRVARWIVECLVDEDCQVDSLLLPPPEGQPGHRRNVTRVPDTKVDVTWLEAAPFRTIKVTWIEEDDSATESL